MNCFCKQEYVPWQALLRKFGRNPRSQGSESNVKKLIRKIKKLSITKLTSISTWGQMASGRLNDLGVSVFPRVVFSDSILRWQIIRATGLARGWVGGGGWAGLGGRRGERSHR